MWVLQVFLRTLLSRHSMTCAVAEQRAAQAEREKLKESQISQDQSLDMDN